MGGMHPKEDETTEHFNKSLVYCNLLGGLVRKGLQEKMEYHQSSI